MVQRMSNGTNINTRKFWTPLRLVLTVIVLGMLALFGATSCNSVDPTPTPSSPTKPATPGAPGLMVLPPVVSSAEIKIANGTQVRLSDYSGKVLFVNLWATWCGPCRMEIPELVAINKEFQERGVEMFGLSTEDPEASEESVKEFIKTFNMDYHVGWSPREVSLALMQGRESIPKSFVITRDGKILKRFIGFSPRIAPQIRQALEEALKYTG
jgi:thiol-disulfide isomerase/thioredoxin